MNSFGRLGLASLSLLLVACSQVPGASPSPSPAPTTPVPSPTPSPTPPIGLTGRIFLSTNVSVDGAPFALADGTRIRLVFDNGTLSASAGCNIIGGDLDIDSTTLHFSGASMTEMACDPPRMAQDDWLVNFLTSTPTFVLDGFDLTLTSGTTVVALLDREIAEPDQALAGPTWGVASFIDGDVVSSVPAGISAAFTFADDGTFSANFGCNSGGGRYAIDGDTITFSDVVMTKMACGGAGGAIESAVLSVVGADGPITIAIDAGSLTLMAGSIGLQLSAATDLPLNQ
jgi:heat shock protein HslJ